jgi:hypothetical protein
MKIMSQFSLIPIKAYLNKEFSFCNRWGFLSRAGLWDKSHLMRQIEKYTLPLQSPPYLCANFSHFSMLLKMVCIILIAGMLIYIPPGSQISSTTPLSCTSVHKNRYDDILHHVFWWCIYLFIMVNEMTLHISFPIADVSSWFAFILPDTD